MKQVFGSHAMGHAGLLHGQSACDGEKSIQTPGPGASENGGM